jgi:hypothetical protein
VEPAGALAGARGLLGCTRLHCPRSSAAETRWYCKVCSSLTNINPLRPTNPPGRRLCRVPHVAAAGRRRRPRRAAAGIAKRPPVVTLVCRVVLPAAEPRAAGARAGAVHAHRPAERRGESSLVRFVRRQGSGRGAVWGGRAASLLLRLASITCSRALCQPPQPNNTETNQHHHPSKPTTKHQPGRRPVPYPGRDDGPDARVVQRFEVRRRPGHVGVARVAAERGADPGPEAGGGRAAGVGRGEHARRWGGEGCAFLRCVLDGLGSGG